MQYIAKRSGDDGYMLIDSESLEARIFSNKELISYLRDGNKIINLGGKGRFIDDSGTSHICTYSKEFYEYLSTVRRIEFIDDYGKSDLRFNMTRSRIDIINNYPAREERNKLCRIQTGDLCVSMIGDEYAINVYAQGYHYLLNIEPKTLGGLYFNGVYYVVCIGTGAKGLGDCILHPDIDSRYVTCLGAVEYRAFKRRVLLCTI